MTTLWLVEIHDDDFEYDQFVAAAVWAETAEQAEAIMRDTQRLGGHSGVYEAKHARPWIWKEGVRLTVTPAPTEGVALVHWHAG